MEKLPSLCKAVRSTEELVDYLKPFETGYGTILFHEYYDPENTSNDLNNKTPGDDDIVLENIDALYYVYKNTAVGYDIIGKTNNGYYFRLSLRETDGKDDSYDHVANVYRFITTSSDVLMRCLNTYEKHTIGEDRLAEMQQMIYHEKRNKNNNNNNNNNNNSNSNNSNTNELGLRYNNSYGTVVRKPRLSTIAEDAYPNGNNDEGLRKYDKLFSLQRVLKELKSLEHFITDLGQIKYYLDRYKDIVDIQYVDHIYWCHFEISREEDIRYNIIGRVYKSPATVYFFAIGLRHQEERQERSDDTNETFGEDIDDQGYDREPYNSFSHMYISLYESYKEVINDFNRERDPKLRSVLLKIEEMNR